MSIARKLMLLIGLAAFFCALAIVVSSKSVLETFLLEHAITHSVFELEGVPKRISVVMDRSERALLSELLIVKDFLGAEDVIVFDNRGKVVNNARVSPVGSIAAVSVPAYEKWGTPYRHFIRGDMMMIDVPIYQHEGDVDEFLFTGGDDARAGERLGFLRAIVSLKPMRETAAGILRAIAVVAGIMCLLTGLTVIFFLKRILLPITLLERATREIAGGHFGVQVPVVSADELGRLSENFNRMSESLKETTVSKSYVESVFESVGTALLVCGEDWKVTSANDAACKLLCVGYGPDCGEVCDGNKDFGSLDVRTMLPFEPSAALGRIKEGRLHREGRDDVLAAVSIAPIGSEQGYVLSVHDLSEREKMEGRLIQAEKLGAVGQLAAGIAHEFNNILTGIMGLAHLVRQDLPKESPSLGDMDGILEASGKAADLVAQLLAFSRQKASSFEVFDLCGMVRSRLKILGSVTGETVELSASLPDESALIRGSTEQLERVLMNLIINSRDAIDGDGVIEISLKQVRGEKGRRFSRLAVRDTGSGMDSATRAEIFTPFFTTKAVGKGTGLGLAVVHGIVEEHGGTIDVVSDSGRGTTISILLPEAMPEEQQGNPSETGASRLKPDYHRTILLAEDNDISRRTLRRVLERAGYTVLEAADGGEALAAIEDKEFDAAVLDVIMPKCKGVEVARRLAECRPDVKILMMSGYAAEEFHEAISKGGWPFIKKPFDPSGLVEAVDRLFLREDGA